MLLQGCFKKVKEEVQITNIDVDLAGVRKTKKGELLLEMKDTETGDKIKGIFDAKLKDLKIRELGKDDSGRQRYIIRACVMKKRYWSR